MGTSIGMLNENTTIFCNKNSLVHQYFSLVKLTIPSSQGAPDVDLIEQSCDMVISVTSGIYFHETYNASTTLPLVLVYPSHYPDILLLWSDKIRWKHWMIENGFGNYIAKPVDINKPTYPFILKEGLSENSQGVSVIEVPSQLQLKLKYFKDNNITNYYGEEALIGMGSGQGIFYVSAYHGKVLNIQTYVYLITQSSITQQNLPPSIFIAGRSHDKTTTSLQGSVYRIKNDITIINLIKKITKKGMYSGIFCAEFKMNTFRHIIFIEFNARICYKLTQVYAYFIESYLPLAYAVHRHIRSSSTGHSRRVNRLISSSNQWYHNKAMRELADSYMIQSTDSIAFHAKLPSLSEVLARRETDGVT